MKAFSVIFLFISSLAFSQSYVSEYFYYSDPRGFGQTDAVESFEVTGKVKRISSNTHHFILNSEIEKKIFKYDSIGKFYLKSEETLEFTTSGRLESTFYINKNGKINLTEKYFFDELGQKIRKEEYHSKDFSYVEKFVYDNGNLIERWIKTSLQNDFFLKKRNTYNDKNQLIRTEDLNNNQRISKSSYCKGGIPVHDLMNDYYYNTDGLINKILKYIYTYDSASTPSPNESQFKLYETYEVEFLNGRKVKENRYGIDYLDYKRPYEESTLYKYDEFGNLIYEETLGENPKYSRYFKQYFYTKNKLSRMDEGSLKEVSEKSYYNENGNLIRIEEIKKNKVTDYRNFNDSGFLINGKRDGEIYDFKIEYDSKGNWIKYSTYKENVLIREKQRIIEYYE